MWVPVGTQYSKLQINERFVKVKEEYNGLESILTEHT